MLSSFLNSKCSLHINRHLGAADKKYLLVFWGYLTPYLMSKCAGHAEECLDQPILCYPKKITNRGSCNTVSSY